jgi:hypothetical protein
LGSVTPAPPWPQFYFGFPGAIRGRAVREFMLRARPEQQERFLRTLH